MEDGGVGPIALQTRSDICLTESGIEVNDITQMMASRTRLGEVFLCSDFISQTVDVGTSCVNRTVAVLGVTYLPTQVMCVTFLRCWDRVRLVTVDVLDDFFMPVPVEHQSDERKTDKTGVDGR